MAWSVKTREWQVPPQLGLLDLPSFEIVDGAVQTGLKFGPLSPLAFENLDEREGEIATPYACKGCFQSSVLPGGLCARRPPVIGLSSSRFETYVDCK